MAHSELVTRNHSSRNPPRVYDAAPASPTARAAERAFVERDFLDSKEPTCSCTIQACLNQFLSALADICTYIWTLLSPATAKVAQNLNPFDFFFRELLEKHPKLKEIAQQNPAKPLSSVLEEIRNHSELYLDQAEGRNSFFGLFESGAGSFNRSSHSRRLWLEQELFHETASRFKLEKPLTIVSYEDQGLLQTLMSVHTLMDRGFSRLNLTLIGPSEQALAPFNVIVRALSQEQGAQLQMRTYPDAHHFLEASAEESIDVIYVSGLMDIPSHIGNLLNLREKLCDRGRVFIAIDEQTAVMDRETVLRSRASSEPLIQHMIYDVEQNQALFSKKRERGQLSYTIFATNSIGMDIEILKTLLKQVPRIHVKIVASSSHVQKTFEDCLRYFITSDGQLSIVFVDSESLKSRVLAGAHEDIVTCLPFAGNQAQLLEELPWLKRVHEQGSVYIAHQDLGIWSFSPERGCTIFEDLGSNRQQILALHS
jgi:hypothetical protein